MRENIGKQRIGSSKEVPFLSALSHSLQPLWQKPFAECSVFWMQESINAFSEKLWSVPLFLSHKTSPSKPPAAYRWGGISTSPQDICPWSPAGMGNLSNVHLLQRQIPQGTRWCTQEHKVSWLKGGFKSIHQLNSVWEGLCVLAHPHAVHGRIVSWNNCSCWWKGRMSLAGKTCKASHRLPVWYWISAEDR